MSSGNFPNLSGLIASQWPTGIEGGSLFAGNGSNIVVGANPPYSVTDYFAFYPNFGGATSPATGTLTGNILSPVEEGQINGFQVGQPVSGPGIPSGTTVQAVDFTDIPNVLTLSQAGTVGGSVALTVWNPDNYVIPAPVLAAYINLASASLMWARWRDTWLFGMALYINHFSTLWLRASGDACSSPGRIAAAGLARGITISKSVGPVSQGMQVVAGLDDWGSWNQTEAGLQFATFAKVMGMGPMLVW